GLSQGAGGAVSPRVVLVGPPGSGKTTVGESLAAKLGVSFRDTDQDVEARAGRTISDLFVEEGEPYFRTLEVEAVRVALDEHDGGRAPYDVVIGAGARAAIGGLVGGARTAAVVCDQQVERLAGPVVDALEATGARVVPVAVRGGEAAKEIGTVEALWAELATA